jgi:hypothetical protein
MTNAQTIEDAVTPDTVAMTFVFIGFRIRHREGCAPVRLWVYELRWSEAA